MVFGRAVERGAIKRELLPERVKSLPFDLLRHEIVTTIALVPADVLAEIVDTAFRPLVR